MPNHDRECLTCVYLFECEVKPEEVENCIKYEERKKC